MKKPATLLSIGWLSLAGYLSLAFLSWTGMVYRPHWLSKFLLVPILAVLAFSYYRAIRIQPLLSLRVIVGFGAAFAFVGSVTIPFDSTDAFFYMATGWSQAEYHANPYSKTLREIPDFDIDPMITSKWMSQNGNPYLDLPVPYGFLFSWLSRELARLGSGNWWLTIALFNLQNLIAHAGNALLVWRLARRLPGGNPERALLLYAWNPLMITQFLAELHNDVLMAFFILLAAYCLVSNRPAFILPSLVAGGLIKYLAFVLLPFAFVAMARRFGLRSLLIGATAAAAIFAALFSTYALDDVKYKTPVIAAQIGESSGSVHHFVAVVLIRPLGRMLPEITQITPSLDVVLRDLLWLAFCAVALRELLRLLGPHLSQRELLVQWIKMLSVVLFVASSLFQPWYIGAVLPLAVVEDRHWTSRALILSSMIYLVSFTSIRRKIVVLILCSVLPFTLAWRKAGHQGEADSHFKWGGSGIDVI